MKYSFHNYIYICGSLTKTVKKNKAKILIPSVLILFIQKNVEKCIPISSNSQSHVHSNPQFPQHPPPTNLIERSPTPPITLALYTLWSDPPLISLSLPQSGQQKTSTSSRHFCTDLETSLGIFYQHSDNIVVYTQRVVHLTTARLLKLSPKMSDGIA